MPWGMYERAINHLDRLRAENPENSFAEAAKAFLLSDRAGLLAARRRMANGVDAEMVDLLIEHFGESFFDASAWIPICSTISVPAGASAEHRAIADQLAKSFALPVAVAHNPPAEGGIPGNCIWLEVRPMDGTPDAEGYIILQTLKSTVIAATSEQRLAAAVRRFIESSRQHDGKRQVPFGLTTSFVLARCSIIDCRTAFRDFGLKLLASVLPKSRRKKRRACRMVFCSDVGKPSLT